MSAESKCHACGSTLDDQAKYCGDCGTKVQQFSTAQASQAPPNPSTAACSPAPVHSPPPAPFQTPAQVGDAQVSPMPGAHSPQPVSPSSTFAAVTLLCYLCVFPLGVLLNFIGLVTGPRRGCFVAMLGLVLLPTVLVGSITVILFANGVFGDPEIIRFEVEHFLRNGFTKEEPLPDYPEAPIQYIPSHAPDDPFLLPPAPAASS